MLESADECLCSSKFRWSSSSSSAFALLLAQDQETLHIKSGVAAEDPVFPDYVASLTGSGITRGDEYQILVNGVQIFPAMLDAIRQARRRINFETYIYDTGKVAEDFTTALADAAARGVEVRLIVDAVGASAMERGHVERLQRAGAQIGTFNPVNWYPSRRSTTGRTARSSSSTAMWHSPAGLVWPITGSGMPMRRNTGVTPTCG